MFNIKFLLIILLFNLNSVRSKKERGLFSIECIVNLKDFSFNFFNIMLNFEKNIRKIDATLINDFFNSLSEVSYQCFNYEWYFNVDECTFNIVENINKLVKIYYNYVEKKEYPNVKDLFDIFSSLYHLKDVCLEDLLKTKLNLKRKNISNL